MERPQRSGSLNWKGSEIPVLYGIRGVSAMNVLLYHLGFTFANGTYGVIWFFVLSGFLITHLLQREYDRTAHISLRKFYLRRALRIFPAFYGYAIFYIVARVLMHVSIDWTALLSCLTYTGNYFFAFSGHPIGTMVPTWSLAVEEQFYLIWPFIFLLFAGSRRKLMRGLIIAIIALWAYRWIATLWEFNPTYIFDAFETRADALAIGCLLAVANREGRIPEWLIRRKLLSALALAITIASALFGLNGPRYSWAIVAVAFAVILVQAIANCESIWFRWLDSRPLHALGVISYSLYLYHPFANRLPAAFHQLPTEILFALALATASYWIVEKPFLLVKGHLRSSPSLAPEALCQSETA